MKVLGSTQNYGGSFLGESEENLLRKTLGAYDPRHDSTIL